MPLEKAITKLFALDTGRPFRVNYLASLFTVGFTILSLICITGLSPISTFGGKVNEMVAVDGIALYVTKV